MFNDDMARVSVCGKEYPYRCDMAVLEKIQKEYGDVLDYEYAIRGVIPYYDEETGLRVRKKDRSTIPDVGKVCRSLIWMIREGIEISGEELKPPTEKELMQQREIPITRLALYCFEEYSKCFLSREGRRNAQKKGMNRRGSKPTK